GAGPGRAGRCRRRTARAWCCAPPRRERLRRRRYRTGPAASPEGHHVAPSSPRPRSPPLQEGWSSSWAGCRLRLQESPYDTPGPRVQRYTSQPTEMTMQRRDFIRLAGLGMTVDAEAIGQSTRVPPKKALMTVGTQHDDSNEVLTVLAALGVNHICSRLPSAKFDDAWSVDGLSRLRERVESFGIALDVVPLPLSSNEISR